MLHGSPFLCLLSCSLPAPQPSIVHANSLLVRLPLPLPLPLPLIRMLCLAHLPAMASSLVVVRRAVTSVALLARSSRAALVEAGNSQTRHGEASDDV